MDEVLLPKKRFIESSSFYKNNDSLNPFSEMKIDDSTFLEDVPSRSLCPKCNRSRRYYCYTCYVSVQEVSSRLPIVSLPVKIDIIKHPKEVDGKSTSAHAAVLAPEDVKVYIYPNIPSYDNEKVLLIFPGESALTFEKWWLLQKQSACENNSLMSNKNQIAANNLPYETEQDVSSLKEHLDDKILHKHQNNEKPQLPFSKVVFIDSTWRQSKALYGDPRIKSLPCVILKSHKSLFWRPQRGKPDTYLATVEAIYYFLVELHSAMYHGETYKGEYDNMLFFFKFMYFKIKCVYDR